MEDPAIHNPYEQSTENKEGFQTGKITVCIGERDHHEGFLPEGISMAKRGRDEGVRIPGIDNVAFAGEGYYLDMQGISHDGRYTGSFLISEANPNDKLSESYFGCVGLVVIGKMIDRDENISIIVHIPVYQTDDNKFIESLIDRLSELGNKVELGTIDAIVFGGKIRGNDPKLITDYEKGMLEISTIVEEKFSIKPRIAANPKNEQIISDDVYLDTHQRRLYLMQNPA
ncbi:MAG: hypothetical protein QG640_37 [Patescibacteria group bacterium]|nr:hypothetical protein [Patescibacteria group bacterium]